MASIIYLIRVLSSRRKRRRKNSFSFQRREEEKSTSNIYIYIFYKKEKRKNYVCNFNKTYPSSIYISVSFLSCLRVESTISCLRTNTIINQKRWLRARKIFFLAQHPFLSACVLPSLPVDLEITPSAPTLVNYMQLLYRPPKGDGVTPYNGTLKPIHRDFFKPCCNNSDETHVLTG